MERPYFTPRIPRHLPHRPHNEEDDYEEEEEEEIYDDDDDEDNIRSQQSKDSFVRSRISAHRLSPHFIYPNPAPYYGRPLGHSHRHGRHETDTDDEDNEDQQFRKRGGFLDRRGRPYGIGRDRAYLIRRRRSYEDEGLDCDFSGDEHDEFGF